MAITEYPCNVWLLLNIPVMYGYLKFSDGDGPNLCRVKK